MAKNVPYQRCPTESTITSNPANSISPPSLPPSSSQQMRQTLSDHAQLLKEQSFLSTALVSRLQKLETELETLQLLCNEQWKDCPGQQRNERPINQDANAPAARLTETKSRKRSGENMPKDTAERRKQLRKETLAAILESFAETDEE